MRVDRREFRVTDENTRVRLEAIGNSFLTGYHAALHIDPVALKVQATEVEWELQELDFYNDELISNPWGWPRFGSDDDLSGKQHNPFFVRTSDGRYYDIAGDIGLTQEYVTRGIATGDVDGDGDLDFAIAKQWEESWFFRNEFSNTNSALIYLISRVTENRYGSIPDFLFSRTTNSANLCE